MQSDLRSILAGSAAGLLATLPMTAVMLISQKAGYLGESPPRLMSSVALGARGEHDPGDRKAKAVAVELHLAIGAANGALYGALANRVGGKLPDAAQGALFGTIIWFAAYRGWMPALKIMPPMERDRPDRQVTMFLAHLVFGSALGALTRRFAER